MKLKDKIKSLLIRKKNDCSNIFFNKNFSVIGEFNFSPAMYSAIYNAIIFNGCIIKIIEKSSDKIKFIEYIAKLISHESMHMILRNEKGCSRGYDYLISKKYLWHLDERDFSGL